MAILLQALAVRLGVAGGCDLAQACRDAYPRPVYLILWALAEGAIIATDLAEVIGIAIALNLLFNIPMSIGVVLTALDVFLILWLQGLGFRKVEAVVIALTGVIAICFGFEMVHASPEWGEVLRGYVPQSDILKSPAMLYIAMGIIGTTVMPHNLYLHSAIIQTRKIEDTTPSRRQAIRMGVIDSTIALMFALFINSAILILAASAFHSRGMTEIAEIRHAYDLLSPTLGASLASVLFAVALLAFGLNSTVTATLSGQIVMEGFLSFQIAP